MMDSVRQRKSGPGCERCWLHFALWGKLSFHKNANTKYPFHSISTWRFLFSDLQL